MSSAVLPRSYLTDDSNTVVDWLKSWFLTVDHKRIAILYLLAINFFFLLGGLAATVVRIELITPQGDLMSHCR